MLKPPSTFVYMFQEASTSVAGACVALMVGVAAGDGGFCANELHDASTRAKMRNRDRFLTLRLLKKYLWTKPPNLRIFSAVGVCFLLISVSPFGFAVRARSA